jgi:glycosylphosphatidylinositol transamidase (GPIT) subunit GPI8
MHIKKKRGQVPFGYKSSGNGTLIIDEYDYEVLEHARKCKNDFKITMEEVAEQLNKVGLHTKNGKKFSKIGVIRMLNA